MSQYWQTLSHLFAERKNSEKRLISLCGLVIIVLSIQTWLVDPLLAQYQMQTNRLMSLQTHQQSMQNTIQQLQHQLSTNPDADIDIELAQLQAYHHQLTEQLAEKVGSLVSPSQMASLLQEVLEKSQRLKLESLISLPAEPIALQEPVVGAERYFVHPVRIELTGSYFAIRDYLQALENLPVRYYWRRFHYQVGEYPQARLLLEVYTLGTQKEFIGG
ncbi:type 4a pilus biogenesis protein PilO [Vibrio metschnikovii]|uniref:type 4a pilus biogenesis protein PilO n=1 Tax=Vibrio metschnikovii TaxID=28172 RepID=UPI00315CA544